MRLVIQECRNAKVEVENKIVGQIDFGEMVLVGFKPNDDKKIVDNLTPLLYNEDGDEK